MIFVPNSYGARVREHNDCHFPRGTTGRRGGQFCSVADAGKPAGSLRLEGRPERSVSIPTYLRDDVKRAARAGIATVHHQQPEPVQDVTGTLHDPLALSHAQHGEYAFFDDKGVYWKKPGGKIRIVTRGGVFEPMETVYAPGDYFSSRTQKKALTPEMLTDAATEEDIVSTYRHEVGHLLRRSFRGTEKTPQHLASEISAWQYALEISPTHSISMKMARKGLLSHAYHEFQLQELYNSPEGKRISLWDRAEWAERQIKWAEKNRGGAINEPAMAKARAFTERVLKSFENYAKVLKKRGLVRIPEIRHEPYYPESTRKDKIKPGPGFPNRV